MGVEISGMNEWIADLDSLPERAPKAFRQVAARAGVQMKLEWRTAWQTMPHKHLPHLVLGIGYDTKEKGTAFSVEVGVAATNKQAHLATIISYGTLTSAPHDAGQAALDAELPKMEAAAAQVAEELLAER